MSRKPNIVPVREHKHLEPPLADIEAYAAEPVLVETGTIGEMDACERMDEWKTEHWGRR